MRVSRVGVVLCVLGYHVLTLLCGAVIVVVAAVGGNVGAEDVVDGEVGPVLQLQARGQFPLLVTQPRHHQRLVERDPVFHLHRERD